MSISSKFSLSTAVSLVFALPCASQKIGGVVPISSSGDIHVADASFSVSYARYVVVWARTIGGVTQIRGQRMSATGTPVGSVMSLSSGLNKKASPKIAYVAKSRRMLVVWSEKSGPYWKIVGRTVSPSSGVLSPPADLVRGKRNYIEPDIGGDVGTAESEAILVWRTEGSGLRSGQVMVPASGAPSRSPWTYALTSNDKDRTPSISKSGGTHRRYVVAWTRRNLLDGDIHARSLSKDGLPIGSAVAVTTGSNNDVTPDVDGDGYRFMITWARQEGFAQPYYDVHCRVLRTNSTAVVLEGNNAAVSTRIKADERQPSVGFVGNKFVVSWSWTTGTNRKRIQVRMFTPSSTRPCGTTFSIDGQYSANVRPVLGTAFAGASSSDRALVAFVSEDPSQSFKGALASQLIEGIGKGGKVIDALGGCGLGGKAAAVGPFAIGNRDFRVHLSGASRESSLALLNVTAAGPALVSCGTCEITNPMILLPTVVTKGGAAMRLALPCNNGLIGAGIQFQFYVVGSGTTPCSAVEGFSFSNRLSGQLGQ